MDFHTIDTLKRKIFFRTLILLSIVGSILIAVLVFPLKKDLQEKNTREVQFIIDAKAVSINQFLSTITNIAEQFTSRTQIRKKLMAYNTGDITLEELRQFSHDKLLDALKQSDDAIGITRLDARGKIAVVVNTPVPESFLKTFDSSITKTVIFDPVNISGKQTIVIATPIMDRGKVKVGTDIVLFQTENLASIIKNYDNMGHTGEVFITYFHKGKLQSFFQPRTPYKAEKITPLLDALQKEEQQKGQITHSSQNGWILTHRQLKGTNWYLTFKMKSDELYQIINSTVTRLVFLSVLIIITGLVGVYILTYPLLKRVAEDFKELAQMKKSLEEHKKDLQAQVLQEVEKRREQEKMLIQQSKNAALGEMIGAIAHQWRQPLNIIALTTQNFEDRFFDQEVDEDYLTKYTSNIMSITKHLSSTIDDFRNFFQPNKPKEVFNIFEAVEKSFSLLDAQLKSHHIEYSLRGCNCTFEGYKNEFKQVILNLLNNAKDAIHEMQEKHSGYQGKIEVNVLEEAEYCTISLQDNGCGVPESIRDRIFEPYFTTKEQGKGTGIGLYMSKAIIEDNMNGKIYADSASTKGSRFVIKLPKRVMVQT